MTLADRVFAAVISQLSKADRAKLSWVSGEEETGRSIKTAAASYAARTGMTLPGAMLVIVANRACWNTVHSGCN
jgi:hypothetical protein